MGLSNLLRRERIWRIGVPRSDLSAREAWSIVAPQIEAESEHFLPVQIASGVKPGRPQAGRPSVMRNGRIAHDTTWEFRFRTPDDSRQITYILSGCGDLKFEKHRIKIHLSDTDGRRIKRRAISENWLDSPEVWNVVQNSSSLQQQNLYPGLTSISFKLAEWFEDRHWCWETWHYFNGEGRRDGVTVLVVIDAVSGEILKEEVTRYADGWPISTSS